MTNHERDAALNGLLQEILSVEAEIEGLIDRALPAVRAHTDAREELEELLIATRPTRPRCAPRWIGVVWAAGRASISRPWRFPLGMGALW